MRIQVKGRNVAVSDELRERVERRFAKVAKQVSELAVLEVELCVERNPANPDSSVAEATLYLKGVTLRAKEASRDMEHSINLISDDIAVQANPPRERRRRRRERPSGAVQPALRGGAQPVVWAAG